MVKKRCNSVNATEKVNMGYRKSLYSVAIPERDYTPPKLKGNGND